MTSETSMTSPASVEELLDRLRNLDVRVWLEGEHLRCSAPTGVLTHELRDELRANRDQLREILSKASGRGSSDASADAGDGSSPLSLAQERLWFFQELEPESTAYNVGLLLDLTGPLDVAALAASMTAVVKRQATLRTTFVQTDGRPGQRVNPPLSWPLPVTDLSTLDPAARQLEAESLWKRESEKPFRLVNELPLRTVLLRLAPESHRLMLTLHHIAADGYSIVLMVRELLAYYGALRTETEPAMAPLATSYVEFAAQQREWIRSAASDKSLEYWTKQLGGQLPTLDLPTDHPRPAVQTFRGAVQFATLPPETANDLRALSRKTGCTLFMTMLAAFNALLYRYTGDVDITVGSPVANRDREETRDLIGMFINTLVLRSDLSGDPTFDDLLARVRQTTRQAFAHQELPFARLVDALQPERDTSRTPLFQVMFNMFTLEAPEEMRVAGLTVKPPPLDRLLTSFDGESKFDLTLYAHEQSEGMRLVLVYNADLFSPERMRTFLDHYQRLVRAAVDDPTRRIGEIPLVSSSAARDGACVPHTRRRIAFVELPAHFVESTIPARFGEVATRTPERTVATFGGESLTYASLAAQSDSLAGLVAAATDGSARVALLYDHGAALLAAILGVLKAGSAYVPLDSSFPPERLEFILNDAGVSAILCEPKHAELAARLTSGTRTVIRSDAASAGKRVTPTSPSPDSLAYILYTSGSTGQPKGVAQSHRNALHHARTYINSIELTPDDRLTLVAPYTFDASLMDIFGALLTGAELRPVDIRRDGVDPLAAALRGDGITIFHATPTVYRAAMATLHAGESDTVRCVILGGEEVHPRDVELFRDRFAAGSVFVNGLGPTESTTALQYFYCAGDLPSGTIVPVGYPVPDTDVLLVDDTGHPTSVLGEIAIKSRFVALGYWNQPELTQQVFSHVQGAADTRMYRTGDLGRRRPDGAIEFFGRKDQQVKIRGVRIELGEIEACLEAHPSVVSCAVTAEQIESGERMLAAFVVIDPASGVSVSDLKEHLARSLPANMIPAALVLRESLPLTPTGKIDRRALPSARNLGFENRKEFVAPRNPIEQMLADVWSEVLDVDSIGVHDDFFALGGHSLNATQVISRLRAVTGADLSLRSLFSAPTIDGFAKSIQQFSSPEPSPDAMLRAGHRSADEPLSYSQERMWFLQQLMPDGTAYNMITAIDFTGALDAGAFMASLDDIVARHEILRTTFHSPEGDPRQRVHEAHTIALIERDFGDRPLDDALVAARRLTAEFAAKPFDLENGPLWWVLLMRIADDRHVVTFGFHHIVGDLWSFGVLGHELARFYNARVRGEPVHVAPLDLQYSDFAVWQRDWLEGRRLEEQLAYWKPHLANLAPLELPTDRVRPAVQTAAGDRRVVELPAAVAQRVRALSLREGVTPFMTLFAAFNVVLHRYSGQHDIAVGVPIANRTQVGVERLIGTFVNTLVHRNDLSGDPSFRELLRRVRVVALDAFTHQDLPFERLVRALAPDRDASRSPVFQVMFNMANAPMRASEMALDGITTEPFSFDRSAAQFDLSMSLMLAEQSFVVVSFTPDLFDGPTIDRFLEHYLNVLESVTRNAEQHIGRLSMLSPTERRALTETRNATSAPFPNDPVTAIIAAQAQRTPNAIAVEYDGVATSYRALDARANQLAHYLRRRGVQAGALVGVSLSRSAEMVVALLGVLKTGAAYVPIDPAYPAHRVQFMLEDSGATAIVTESKLAARLPSSTASIIAIDGDKSAIDQESSAAIEPAPSPDSRAYVIYTSGSTGNPKGVAISHASLVNFLSSMGRTPGLAADDVLLAVTTISFDIAGLELYLPLVCGATVVLASREVAADGRRLRELLTRRQPTVMQATPATWRSLIDAGWAAGETPELRVLCGGEALPRELAEELLTRAREVWNLYGPTETTIWSTVHRVSHGTGPVPIGEPIANTRIYVLDQGGQLVPIGVPGELFIGGAGVAIEYLNRPELTASRFVDDPFAASGGRMYRTGDRVRFGADGALEHLGRFDQQVKLRGYRIELGEIEAALAAAPEVNQCVVDVRHERLAAYVVFTKGTELTASEIRTLLRDTLPDFMIPSLVVPLEALPLTPNGKVDRKALPDPLRSAGRAVTSYHPPTTPNEVVIATVWKDILGVERVSTTDNFFELGGHSLLSMRAVHEIHRRTGWRPDPRLLFFETLGKIASAKTETSES
ncbi:MAG: amino acid adenylation domain-containing protein [bacterium]